MADPLVEAICEDLQRRPAPEHGVPLTAGDRDWLQREYEAHLDQVLYLRRALVALELGEPPRKKPQTKLVPGMRFGRLETVAFVRMVGRGHAIWRVRCDCGVVKESWAKVLTRGGTTSCGCWLRERTTMAAKSMPRDAKGRYL